jgi:hypothetical protein
MRHDTLLRRSVLPEVLYAEDIGVALELPLSRATRALAEGVRQDHSHRGPARTGRNEFPDATGTDAEPWVRGEAKQIRLD